MSVGESVKNVLPGMGSQHADDKKSDNHCEDPEFPEEMPDPHSNRTGPLATHCVFPRSAFVIGSHDFNFLQTDFMVSSGWKQAIPLADDALL
jgi:hypothetical protein